jgi:hypothetical protein
MDLILQNIRIDRTLWGSDKYRILSFGNPSSVGEYRDIQGRLWITAAWVIGFDDKIQLMYILPLPNGPVVATTMQATDKKYVYEWDMEKTCDHIYAAYSASFAEWTDFLSTEKYIPGFLKDMKFEWVPGNQEFFLDCGALSLRAGRDVFNWTDDSELFMAPSWYKQEAVPEYGVRKFIINRDVRGKEYVVMYRNIKPDPILGSSALENWNDLVSKKYPFDEKPAISPRENTGSVGTLIDARRANPDVIHSLYIAMDDPQDEANFSSRLAALKNGIVIAE